MQGEYLLEFGSQAFLVPRNMTSFFNDVHTTQDLTQLGRLTLNALADHWERAADAHRQHLERRCPPTHPRNKHLLLMDCSAVLRCLALEAHPRMPLATPLRMMTHFDRGAIEYRPGSWQRQNAIPFVRLPETTQPEEVRRATFMTPDEFSFFMGHLNAFERWLTIARRDRASHDNHHVFKGMTVAMDRLYRDSRLRSRALVQLCQRST